MPKKPNAVTAEAKQQRRQDYLNTARALFLQQHSLPSVAALAAEAGLAKGTVYRYFQSKEQIFIALLSDDFSQLFAGLAQLIDELPVQPKDAAGHFAAGYTALLQQSDSLLPLMAMLTAVLEQKLPQAELLSFKQQLAEALQALGQRLATRLIGVTTEQAAQLLLHSYALTLWLYQATCLPDAVQQMLQQAGLQALKRDFNAELPTALSALWLGRFTQA